MKDFALNLWGFALTLVSVGTKVNCRIVNVRDLMSEFKAK